MVRAYPVTRKGELARRQAEGVASTPRPLAGISFATISIFIFANRSSGCAAVRGLKDSSASKVLAEKSPPRRSVHRRWTLGLEKGERAV
jgi:hypothetical protein